MTARYWPWNVIPVERQTEYHKKEIAFFEQAYLEGFRPYLDGFEYGATSSAGRIGMFIQRGLTRGWSGEIRLGGAPDETGGSFFVNDFSCAANAVLRWLRGEDLVPITADLKDHLVTRPDRTRPTKPCPWCGKPLKTEKAQQCFECGMDWHDPANVVRHH
jgi:hypothetical protein